jgi:predicted transcriptional regulator
LKKFDKAVKQTGQSKTFIVEKAIKDFVKKVLG